MLWTCKIALVSGSLLFLLRPSQTCAQWVHLGLQNENITSVIVDPRNGNNIYAASEISSADGRILRSTDGGLQWEVLLDSVIVTNLAMHPENSSILYAALYSRTTGSPAIIKTINAGATWFRADSGVFVDIEGGGFGLAINPERPDIMFASSGGFFGGALFKTTNAGETWSYVSDTSGPRGGNILAIGIDPDSTNRVYVSDASTGRFYISTDDGDSWRETLPDILNGGGAYQMAFGRPTSTIYLANQRTALAQKGMFKSTDQGETWSNIATGIPGNNAIVFSVIRKKQSTPDELFIGVHWWNDFSADSLFGAGVFTSRDSGHTWQYIGLDSAFIYSLALSPDETYLYAVVESARGGFPLGLYRLALTTEAVREPPPQVRSFRLSQNYPNPFNSSTTFLYDLPFRGTVSINIYNVFGQEVQILHVGEKDPGSYSARWDGANNRGAIVGSGVYYYRLEAVNTSDPGTALSQTRKMLFIK